MTRESIIPRIMIILLFCMCLAGCKKTEQENKTTEQGNETTNVPSSPEKEFAVRVYPTVYSTSNTISWLLPFYSELTEKNRNEINRIIYEKGMDCQIQFIKTSPIIGKDFESWLQEYEKTNPIDIITSGVWSLGDPQQSRFVENRMVLLNEYLETEEARALKGTYTEEEWKSVSIDQKVYVIPEAAYQLEDSFQVEVGGYVYVNESYLDYFEEFDGTYDSLRRIYDKISDSNLHIVIDGIPGGVCLYGLLGYSSLFYELLPYNDETQKTVNLVDGNEAKDLIKQMYEDVRSGVIVNLQTSGKMPDKVLAYIHGGGSISQEGYKENRIACSLYDFNCAGKFGVSVNSTQKELAEQVLSICLSDPEILCQLYPGIDIETMAKRTELLKNHPENDMAGIRLNFTEEQVNSLSQFENLYSIIISGMYLRKDDGSYQLNPDFDIEREWKRLSEETGSYVDLCESANQQIQEWLQK